MQLPIDKAAVVAAFVAHLRGEVEALVHATGLARAAATDEHARPENKYDTRAVEASYLAAGQGARLAELRTLLSWFQVLDPENVHERVGLGSLVELEDEEGARSWVLVAPSAVHPVAVGALRVQGISPRAALGGALVDLETGDFAEVVAPSGTREVEVVRVL